MNGLRISAAILAVAGAAFTAFFGMVLGALSKMDAGGPGGLEGAAIDGLPWVGLALTLVGVVLLWRAPRAAPWILLAAGLLFAIPMVLLGVKIGAYVGIAGVLLAAGLATRT